MKNSDFVEKKLNVELPQDYKSFLDKEGYYVFENIGLEVYGYRPSFDINKIPCVIAADKLLKKNYALDTHELPISDLGYDGLIVVLNCLSSQVIEKSLQNESIVVANTFQEWFEKQSQLDKSVS